MCIKKQINNIIRLSKRIGRFHQAEIENLSKHSKSQEHTDMFILQTIRAKVFLKQLLYGVHVPNNIINV